MVLPYLRCVHFDYFDHCMCFLSEGEHPAGLLGYMREVHAQQTHAACSQPTAAASCGQDVLADVLLHVWDQVGQAV